jgi:hypothetical protein
MATGIPEAEAAPAETPDIGLEIADVAAVRCHQ